RIRRGRLKDRGCPQSYSSSTCCCACIPGSRRSASRVRRPNARQALASHLLPLTLTRSLNGGARGIFLDQRDEVVGGILDGGNVCLGERLIRGEFLAHVV